MIEKSTYSDLSSLWRPGQPELQTNPSTRLFFSLLFFFSPLFHGRPEIKSVRAQAENLGAHCQSNFHEEPVWLQHTGLDSFDQLGSVFR